VSQRLVGTQHLKLVLKLDDERMIDAIAFNIDTNTWPNHRCQKIHAAYRLDVNEFRGVRSVQLVLENIEER
jgi:single-stranded-DNA-specific exonuclease